MKDETIRPGSIDSLHPPVPNGQEARSRLEVSELPERVDFILRYDEEITFLVNEGLVRPGMQPSGLK